MATFEQKWEHDFKPETRSTGRKILAKGIVQLTQPSDTEIQAFVRVSPPIKISFKTESVESRLVTVSCSCPQGKRAQFCKHVWAVLLQIESSKPDFLEGKEEIEMTATDAVAVIKNAARPLGAPPAPSVEHLERQQAMKDRQNSYRKEQYQKQKQRLKDQKSGQKSNRTSKFAGFPAFSESVQSALDYFSENGFALVESLNTESVQHAKKTLSRVFHPDKGGTHAEILELNRNVDVLLDFVGSR